MLKLSEIILEANGRPKVVIMAGSAGAGKSFLLNQLDLNSLPLVNPDKYVEDPQHPAYNNLGQGVRLADKEAENLSTKKRSFVWDTTASNPAKVKELVDKGYDIYMVMVYTHPMISYISNFSRERNIPGAAVFSTWRNVYQLINQYNKMLKGNLSIHINDRGGKHDKEIEAFNTAAKNGPQGIKDYLERYNEREGVGKSTFFKPVEMSKQEEDEFKKATADIDYDRDNRSEDKALKNAFLKFYRKNSVVPGDDQLLDTLRKYRTTKEKNDKRQEEVLESIAQMLFDPKFQDLLQDSSPAEIDNNVQNFLA